LLVASLNDKEATTLAEMEGLVTHLTSLVLVDQEGAKQTGLPGMRKVALSTPRTSRQSFARAAPIFACALSAKPSGVPRRLKMLHAPRDALESFQHEDKAREAAVLVGEAEGGEANKAKQAHQFGHRDEFHLTDLAASICWRKLSDGAAARKLGRLDQAKRKRIVAAAQLPLVRKAAAEMGILPVALVLGLMARFMASRDRHAARIAKALLGDDSSWPSSVVTVADLFKLDGDVTRLPN
jgi:hypothetical protein